MNRRSLLLGLGAALAAPAIVKANSLMKLWVPDGPKLVIDRDPATLDDYKEGIWIISWDMSSFGKDRSVSYIYDEKSALVLPLHNAEIQRVDWAFQEHKIG